MKKTTILETLTAMMAGRYCVSLESLRAARPEFDRDHMDSVLLGLAGAGRIRLVMHDDPGSMSAGQRAASIPADNRCVWYAASVA